MFQKDTALEKFTGLAVTLSTGEKGLWKLIFMEHKTIEC